MSGEKNSTLMLPTGVFEMTPGKAAFIRRIEDILLDIFAHWGYQEVRTPAMEYMEAMSLGLDPDELDMAFKLVDRSSGRMMVLRSDVTPQVARMTAGAMAGVPLPLRLCYVADVYRYPSDPSHPGRELIQAGVELVGLEDPQADAEAIALAVRGLEKTGLRQVRMSVGQVGFAGGLFKEAGLDRKTEDSIVRVAVLKDRSGMERILDRAGVRKDIREAVLSLTGLSGGMEVLDQAEQTVMCDECGAALENLREVLDLAKLYGVRDQQLLVDLGELAAFRYHTGVVFTGYVEGPGRAVLKGGRYDGLVEKFGRTAPATGFAIDILDIVDTLSGIISIEPAVDYLLLNRTGEKGEGLRLAVKLREKGLKVLCLIRDIPDRELEAFVQAHRIGKTLVIDSEGLWVLHGDTGRKQRCTLEEL